MVSRLRRARVISSRIILFTFRFFFIMGHYRCRVLFGLSTWNCLESRIKNYSFSANTEHPCWSSSFTLISAIEHGDLSRGHEMIIIIFIIMMISNINILCSMFIYCSSVSGFYKQTKLTKICTSILYYDILLKLWLWQFNISLIYSIIYIIILIIIYKLHIIYKYNITNGGGYCVIFHRQPLRNFVPTV